MKNKVYKWFKDSRRFFRPCYPQTLNMDLNFQIKYVAYQSVTYKQILMELKAAATYTNS